MPPKRIVKEAKRDSSCTRPSNAEELKRTPRHARRPGGGRSTPTPLTGRVEASLSTKAVTETMGVWLTPPSAALNPGSLEASRRAATSAGAKPRAALQVSPRLSGNFLSLPPRRT